MIQGFTIASASIPPLFALLALMLAGVVLVSLLLLRLRLTNVVMQCNMRTRING